MAPENTIEAFTTALRLGATGLESDVWLTADGVPVLDHDGVVRAGVRKRPIGQVDRADLPQHIPSLAELFEVVGTSVPLSLDVKDAAAAAPVIDVARAAGGEAVRNLWLCTPRWEQAASWRSLSDDVRLVDSTRMKHLKEGPERRAATLAAHGVDAVNMHHTDWSSGLTTLFHRFELHCFAWDCQFERVVVKMLGLGIDGVYSDDVGMMMGCLEAWSR